MTAHSAAAPAKATLITFPPSLDCELSRFVLGYYAIPYEEVRHTVLFSFFSTLWHGGTLHFPLLYGGGYPTLDTIRKMIDQFDASCPADRKLLLAGSDHDAVEADWTQFNAVLGGATASYAYFHLLPHRAIMIRPLTEGTPFYEVAAAPAPVRSASAAAPASPSAPGRRDCARRCAPSPRRDGSRPSWC